LNPDGTIHMHTPDDENQGTPIVFLTQEEITILKDFAAYLHDLKK